jgi:hypothetical protein
MPPVKCDGKKADGTPEDCQLTRALAMLGDATAFKTALTQAGSARQQ